ncbi:hypothetical protein TRIUR3_19520 [Triticum urartu]|uniref:Disease resistance R13L4/SHOC-2-like LRR domain-containing protein n=1 Tax=Triticum urartu TaxID=4572 RepID=M7ZBH5_TRIUA|nr:hypothetical protein TRIUR3_19520 [Triticum urartu]
MEAFAVALFGAAASAAVSKLSKVIGELSKRRERKASVAVKNDANYIKNDLEFIQVIMQQCFDSSGGHVSPLQLVCIALLRRLAYDIQDCMDSFNADKTTFTEFANEIAGLKARSIDTKDQILSYMKVITLAVNGTSQGAAGTAHQAAPSVPRELQDLLSDQSRQAWLVRNLDCLLYLCLFPPEHDVRTKPLIRRWLAEELVEVEQGAVNNLKILITASIICSTRRGNNGDVKICRPTDETLQWISEMSVSQNFIVLCDGRAQLPADEARRLSVHPPANVKLNLPQNLSRLRTLAVFPAAGANLSNYEAVFDFAKYEMLRVLDLKECGHLSDGHIQAICDLVLMKYLSINLGSIGFITRDIGMLKQLETLDLSGSQTVTVFKEVLLLPKLKHLLGKFQLSRIDITSVPVVGWFESNLERFLRDKSVLETLAGFVTGETLGFPQLMSLMRRLREVKIWCGSNASKRNLKDLSNAITEFIHRTTREPHVHWSLSIHFEGSSGEFTKKIVSVAGKLDSLKLHGLSDIKELCLSSTGLSWDVIRDGLTDVRGLKYLKLIEDNLGSLDILSEAEHLKSIERIFVWKSARVSPNNLSWTLLLSSCGGFHYNKGVLPQVVRFIFPALGFLYMLNKLGDQLLCQFR